MFGRNMGSLTVTAQARDGTWAELWHLSGDQGKNWHLKSINLPPGSQAVKFAAVAGYVYSDLAIDDVKCEAAAITTTTTYWVFVSIAFSCFCYHRDKHYFVLPASERRHGHHDELLRERAGGK